MAITADQARVELAKRELAKREAMRVASPEKKSIGTRVADVVTESPLLPTAGAIAGGIAGVPAIPLTGGLSSMAGAGLGGAFGESVRQMGQRLRGSENAPNTPLEAAKGIGIEGATSAIGEGVGRAAVAVAKPLALPAARRALGFASRFLKTEFARRQANQAARVALEKDIIPLLGSPEVAFQNASNLAKSTGSKIGNVLKNIDFEKIAPDAEYEINILKNKLTKGTDRGLLAGALPVVNEVKDTILQLYGRGLTAAEYNMAKNSLAGSINFLTDNTSQGINKRVVNNMANTIRSTVKKLLPDSFDDFLKNQKLYNAAQLMKRALNDELGGQMGRRVGSLASLATGASQLTSGNPLGAAASVGLVEAAQRRGAGISARTLQGLVRNPQAATVPSQLAGQTILSGLGFGQRRKKE